MHVPTRRSFLTTLMSAPFAFAQPPASQTDVAIVGAGSAGLNAARKLQELGFTTVIVEARNRIGGRAWTETDTFGFPFDRGCAWLHAADDNPYTPLAREWGYTLHKHDNTLDLLYLGDREATAAERDSTGALELRLDEQTYKRGRSGKDIAAERLARRRGLLDDAVATYQGPMSKAVDLDEMSTVDFVTMGTDVEPNLLIKEGYGSLVARYGQGLPVSLNTPVQRIRYSGPGVVLETPSGAINARACIVTASTGVLAAEKIAFDPLLPDWKRDAIDDVPMALFAKIPLQFSQAKFKRNEFDDLLRETRGNRDIYFLAWPFGLNLVVGFVGGDFAWELSAAGEEEAIDFGRGALRKMLGSDVDKYFVKGALTKWASDPWALGAYSAARPGRAASRANLRRPVADRIFFAGEACASRLTQTCSGAAWSGRETAEQVAKILRR